MPFKLEVTAGKTKVVTSRQYSEELQSVLSAFNKTNQKVISLRKNDGLLNRTVHKCEEARILNEVAERTTLDGTFTEAKAKVTPAKPSPAKAKPASAKSTTTQPASSAKTSTPPKTAVSSASKSGASTTPLPIGEITADRINEAAKGKFKSTGGLNKEEIEIVITKCAVTGKAPPDRVTLQNDLTKIVKAWIKLHPSLGN